MGENRVEAIRRRMADVRSDLHENVDEMVQSARELAEWRNYVRRYPWLCLGAAALVGYLVVPKRRPVRRGDLKHLLEALEQSYAEHPRPRATPKDMLHKEEVKEEVKEASWYSGLAGAALGVAANMAVKAATSYATQRLSMLLGNAPDQNSRERHDLYPEGPR